MLEQSLIVTVKFNIFPPPKVIISMEQHSFYYSFYLINIISEHDLT